jgi:hypothetical protein
VPNARAPKRRPLHDEAGRSLGENFARHRGDSDESPGRMHASNDAARDVTVKGGEKCFPGECIEGSGSPRIAPSPRPDREHPCSSARKPEDVCMNFLAVVNPRAPVFGAGARRTTAGGGCAPREKRSRRRGFRTPTAFNPSAQGWREAATLGDRHKQPPTLKGLKPPPDTTHSGLKLFAAETQGSPLPRTTLG